MKRSKQVPVFVARYWWLIVIAAAFITFGLVVFLGRNQDVWFDESYSILLARQNVGTLLSLTGVDAHPPLYYLLLKAWAGIFGWGEFALRSLSALFAAMAVAAMAVFVRRLFSPRVALVTLPLLVLGPFWLRYGYEIRMYALAGFIGIVGSIVLLRAMQQKSDKRWWALYALMVALGVYTLYVTAIIWISHLVWLLVRDRRRFWRQPWFYAYGAAFALFLPYLPTMIFQYTHSALPGIGQELTLSNIGGILSLVTVYLSAGDSSAWAAMGIIIVLVLMVSLLVRAYGRSDAHDRQSLQYLLILALIPTALFIIVSLPLPQPFFIPRYLAHTILFVYALVGVAVALGWRYGFRKSAVALFVVVLVLLVAGVRQLAITGNYNFERSEKQQTSALRNKVNCRGSVVVMDDPYTYINDLYYFGNCELRYYNNWQPPYEGGYAWLSEHGNRLASPAGISDKRIVHVYMNSDWNPDFKPDSRYRLVSSVKDDQQTADTYDLVAR